MRRLLMVVMLTGILLGSFCLAHAMRKLPNMPSGNALVKRGASPSLNAADLAAMKRRIITAKAAMDKFHVVGTKQAPVPSAALDALADWCENGAKDVEIWWDPDWQTPFFIKGHDLALLPKVPLAKYGHNAQLGAAMSTFSTLSGFLSLRDCENELRVLSQNTDQLGLTHVRLQQTYRGHDVWARDLYVHFTADGRMNLINGRWVPTPAQLDGIDPIITADAAALAAAAHFSDRAGVETSERELMVYFDTEQVPHWAWMVRTSLGLTEGYDVFIDAVNGEFLHEVSYVYSDGPVVGSGVDLFGDTRPVYAYQVGSWYYMINTTKPMYNPVTSSLPSDGRGVIQIDDWGSPFLYFVRSLSKDSWSNLAAVSASWHLGYVYDYFLQIHGRNGIDGAGSTILAVVNDPLPQYNGNNAFFNGGTQHMTFGTGDGINFANLAKALDVTGHEMGHGVINAAAGLKYEFQPGAMNESLADIFGVASEFYVYGSSADWLIGEDVVIPSGPNRMWRDMASPADGRPSQPSTMSEYAHRAKDCYPDTCDHGGVHINSGVPNRAFYLIASSINNFWRADSIYYRALTTYLFSYSQFIDLRLAVAQAASDLYPGNTTVANAISSAFDAVEIYAGPPTPPSITQPAPTSAQWIVARDELTGRLAHFDTAGAFLGFVSAGIAMTKPSVPDSSDAVYFIDDTYNVRFVMPDGTGEAQIGNPAIDFANIAVSPDGSKLAYDIQGDPTLYFFDLGNLSTSSWPLYTPTYSESTVVHDVLEADVLEWDIYGQNVMFDCLSALPRQSDTVLYWDIRTMEVATGRIQRTLPAIPVGWQIGNPTFGKIHPDLIAFDFFRGDSVFVYAANLSKNSFRVVSGNGHSGGRPSFAPNDGGIIFEFNSGAGPNLWRIGFNPDSLKTSGIFQLFATNASYANWRFEGRNKTPSGVLEEDEGQGVPAAFTLRQNYPNPFNASTVIEVTLERPGPVMLEVFNILGQRIATPVDEPLTAGMHRINWDGKDQSGRQVASGVYFYRLAAGDQVSTKRMVLLK